MATNYDLEQIIASESSVDSDEECGVDSTQDLVIVNDVYVDINSLGREEFDYKEVEAKFEINPGSLIIGQRLGEGFFGDVYMGTLSQPIGIVPVAVKMPKAVEQVPTNSTEVVDRRKKERKLLRSELKIMAQLQTISGGHDNVLSLVGAITKVRDEFCILTEYCDCGSIDQFLRKKYNNEEFENEVIFEEGEETWSWKIIHMDIALRNVLLKSDFTLKIADFGLSKQLMDTENAYYVWKNNTALPIRYIAPESLNFGRFMIHSDRWSFGVAIWELFTFALKQPYLSEYESSGTNLPFFEFLVEFLAAGHRLTLPNIIPTQLKFLIAELWNDESKKRPCFQKCKILIRKELMQSCSKILLNEKPSPSHASEISQFATGEKDDHPSIDSMVNKKQQIMMIRELTCLSVSVIIVAAVILSSLFIVRRLDKSNSNLQTTARPGNGSTSSSEAVRNVHFMSGVPGDIQLFYPFPDGKSGIVFVNNSEIVYVNFLTGERQQPLLTFDYFNPKLEFPVICDVGVVTQWAGTKIYFLSLIKDKNKFYIFSHQLYKSRVLVPKELEKYLYNGGHSDNISVSLSYIDGAVIDHANFIAFSSRPELLKQKLLNVSGYGAGNIICIFFETKMSGMENEETAFYAFQVNIDEFGKITISGTNILNKNQSWKMNGTWIAPFIRKGTRDLYWPLEIYSQSSWKSGTNTTTSNSILISKSVAKVDIFGDRQIKMEKSIEHFDQCPLLTFTSSFRQSPIQIDDNVCYFFNSKLSSASMCCIDFEYKAWRPMRLKGDFKVITGGTVAGKHDDKLYLYGYTSSLSPYIAIVDFIYFKQTYNPFIVPLETPVTTTSFPSIRSQYFDHRSPIRQATCLSSDGQSIFFFPRQRNITESETFVRMYSLTSGSSTVLGDSFSDNMRGIFAFTRSTWTFLIILVFEGPTWFLKSFRINNSYLTFVDKRDIGLDYALDEQYFQQDADGKLYLIGYYYYSTSSTKDKVLFVLSVDVANNGTITFLTLWKRTMVGFASDAFLWSFVFKSEVYSIFSDPIAIGNSGQFEKKMIKLSLRTESLFVLKFRNSLKYLEMANKYGWSTPVVIDELIFFYSMFRQNTVGWETGTIYYIDVHRLSWFAIKLKTSFENMNGRPVLMRSEKDELFLISTCSEPNICSGMSVMKVIDVNQLVKMQKNRSFPL